MLEHKIPFEGHELNLGILEDARVDKPPLLVLPGEPELGYEIYLQTMSQLSDVAQIIFLIHLDVVKV